MTIIRKAGEGDAGRLAELAERTFRDTFEASNTIEDMRLHCAVHYGEAIQAREIVDPTLTSLICEHEGEFIGFAQLRWGQAPDCIGAALPAEIQRLYVASEWHGRGVAQALMTATLDLARAGAADEVWLGVWEHNPRAIAFYRKSGFVEAGDHIFLLGSDPQRDIVMTRPVEPSAGPGSAISSAARPGPA